MKERRQNLRVRPAADYDVRVDHVVDLVTVRLQVTNLALRGMGLVVDELFASVPAGGSLELFITFPDWPRFRTAAVVRHTSGKPGGACGVELPHLTQEQSSALQRAVAELQERGHSA